MNVLWLTLLVFGVIVVVHEAGHYFMFRYYGQRPIVRFRWWGVAVASEDDYVDMKVGQYVICLAAGVAAGAVPLLFARLFNIGNDLSLIYLLACSLDLLQMYVWAFLLSRKPFFRVGMTLREYRIADAHETLELLEAKT